MLVVFLQDIILIMSLIIKIVVIIKVNHKNLIKIKKFIKGYHRGMVQIFMENLLQMERFMICMV